MVSGDGPFEPPKSGDANVQVKCFVLDLDRHGWGAWEVDQDIGRSALDAYFRLSLGLENAKEYHDYVVEGSLRFQGVEHEIKVPPFGLRYREKDSFPISLFMPKTTRPDGTSLLFQ